MTVYRVRLDDKALALATPIVRRARRPHARPRQAGRRGRGSCCSCWREPRYGGGNHGWPARPRPPVERFAYPLPDKPSIAVLPFINVSSDAEQDHLAEGLTDDLITELSKVSGLFVIARHSVFALENTAGKIQEVAAELGVHFVLEGTLQRAGSRLRINVNLIDALTGPFPVGRALRPRIC